MAGAGRGNGRSAYRPRRHLAGGYRARGRGHPARRERPLRGVRRNSGLPQGLPPAPERVRRHTAQHDIRLSGAPDQMGTQRSLSGRLPQGERIIPHEIVDTGPVFENILTGHHLDVCKSPAPIWHERDGGRYIGTGTYSVTRDPEENWLNAGAYRAQVFDAKTVGVLMATGHHGYLHREKYWKRGEPMPLVMVLGGDPLAFFYGGTEAPYGVFEIDIIGGLRGRPVRMVAGKVTGLPFPADAEVVWEGDVTPVCREARQPFG